eukprot:g3992.t1
MQGLARKYNDYQRSSKTLVVIESKDIDTLLKLSNRDARSFFEESSPRHAEDVLEFMANTLNSTAVNEVNNKAKLNVLVVMTNIAIVEDYRDMVLDAFRRMQQGFEKVLLDREGGQKKYGTDLGKFHELVVILLMRVMDYNLNASDLLELVSHDLKLALSILMDILKVEEYELEVFACLSRMLYQFSLPQTFFLDNGDSEMMEHDIGQLGKTLESIAKFATSTSMMETISNTCFRIIMEKKSARRKLNASRRQLQRLVRQSKKAHSMTIANEQYAIIKSSLRELPECDGKKHQWLANIAKFIENIYTYSARHSNIFKRHTALSPVFEDWLFLHICSTICYRATGGETEAGSAIAEETGDDSLEASKLLGAAHAFRLLVILSFRIGTEEQRERLLTQNLTAYLLSETDSVEFFLKHPSIFCLLLFFNINIDSLSLKPRGTERSADTPSPYPEQCLPQYLMPCFVKIRDQYRDQDTTGQYDKLQRISKIIETPGRLPVSRDHRSYEYLRLIFTFEDESTNAVEEGEEEEEEEQEEEGEEEEIEGKIDSIEAKVSSEQSEVEAKVTSSEDNIPTRPTKSKKKIGFGSSYVVTSDKVEEDEEKSTRCDNQSTKTSTTEKKNIKFRLLGDLPSLDRRKSLAVPGKKKSSKPKSSDTMDRLPSEETLNNSEAMKKKKDKDEKRKKKKEKREKKKNSTSR